MAGEGPRPLAQGDSGFSVHPGRADPGPADASRRPSSPPRCSAPLGASAPPRGERLERLLERLAAGGPFTASLAGARVEADGSTLVIGREAGERARGGLARNAAGTPAYAAVWDGRFEVDGGSRGADRPRLWPAGWTACPAMIGSALKACPAAARSALPVLVWRARRRRLPRPFGDGPGTAACLVRDRLAGSLRRDLVANVTCSADSATWRRAPAHPMLRSESSW